MIHVLRPIAQADLDLVALGQCGVGGELELGEIVVPGHRPGDRGAPVARSVTCQVAAVASASIGWLNQIEIVPLSMLVAPSSGARWTTCAPTRVVNEKDASPLSRFPSASCAPATVTA